MDNQQVRLERLIYWLAGIIDGEGCIMLTWKRYKKYENIEPRVIITNNDLHLLSNVCFVLQEIGVGYWISFSKQKSTNVIVKGFKRTKKLLSLIYPILISKRDEAKTVLDFLASRELNQYKWGYSEEEKNLLIECKSLKASKNLRDYTPTLPEFEGREDIVQPNMRMLEARGNYLLAS